MKKCKRCDEEKELSSFYKHSAMKDGYLSFCKECTKKRVTNHRNDNIERIREYDRERGKLPHRIENTVNTTRRRRKEVDGYLSGHNAVARALKKGELIKPDVCEECGEDKRLEAHHEDYSKPLDVNWLCKPCHVQRHK